MGAYDVSGIGISADDILDLVTYGFKHFGHITISVFMIGFGLLDYFLTCLFKYMVVQNQPLLMLLFLLYHYQTLNNHFVNRYDLLLNLSQAILVFSLLMFLSGYNVSKRINNVVLWRRRSHKLAGLYSGIE